MVNRTKVKVEGLRELDDAIGQLKKATARALLRRVLKQAVVPFVNMAQSMAPVLTGGLKLSIGASTKLSRSQKRGLAKAVRQGTRARSFAELHAGPAASQQGHLQEFGTEHHPAQPYMRPAWDATRQTILNSIKALTGAEIKRTADRAARKAARLAARGRR